MTDTTPYRTNPVPVAPPGSIRGAVGRLFLNPGPAEPDEFVWGDEWVQTPRLLLIPAARDRDADELVYFVPGPRPELVVDRLVPIPRTPHEALVASMLHRLNAAYIEPRFAYLSDTLALAAWYGIVATGRSAWLPSAFAAIILESGTDEVSAAADRVFALGISRWRLDRRIRIAASRVRERCCPEIVRGARLRRVDHSPRIEPFDSYEPCSPQSGP